MTTNDGNVISYDLELYGGANKENVDEDDPYVIDNRGYWFNGHSSFMTLKGYSLG